MSKYGEEVSHIYVNGRLCQVGEPHLSVLDRGFTLGDGVFETLRVAGGRAFRLIDHLARLRASARVLELPVDMTDRELTEAIERVRRANRLRNAVVRITISRGVATERGLLPPARPVPTVVVQASPFRGLPAAERGFSVCTSSVRRNELSPTSRIKACAYVDNLLARLEARQLGADEAVLMNTAGYLACCSTANLHLVSELKVLTPALQCGTLAGVTRQVVRELAGELGLAWAEAWLRPADLQSADEAFLTNSVLGIVPITRVDGQKVGSGRPGTVTLALRQRYESLLSRSTESPE